MLRLMKTGRVVTLRGQVMEPLNQMGPQQYWHQEPHCLEH